MSNPDVILCRPNGLRARPMVWSLAALMAGILLLVVTTCLWAAGTVSDAIAEARGEYVTETMEVRAEEARDRLRQQLASKSQAQIAAAFTPRSQDGRDANELLSGFDEVGLLTDDLLPPPNPRVSPLPNAAAIRLRPVLEQLRLDQLSALRPTIGERADDGRAPNVVSRAIMDNGQPLLVLLATLPRQASGSDLRLVFALKQLPAPSVLSGTLDIGRLLRPLIGGEVLLSLLLFAGIAYHLHQTTRDLTRTEAMSKELLGRDPLSGLANRLLFNERLDRELAELTEGGAGLAVMFIDLDRFKDVNDTFGHQAGDDLIRLVARRLLGILSHRETLARFGGDEFAIIQPNVTAQAEVAALSRLLLDAVLEPFDIAGSHVTVGASIGIALAPEHARDRESLMRLADAALYQAKSEGRNRHSFFQSRMDETLRMRKVVEDDLRHAIRDDELKLLYQPLFSSDGQTIVGVEALVRWPHRVRGLISPAEFIAIAEERGLVIPLGDWVLRRACLDGKRWPGLRIAVNVSPLQFRHRSYVASVVRTLEETGFDASRLELELTEGVVVDNADSAEAAMIELRALGVHLALDDFGTGYSSLIYLRRFAFDKIKIDRSFLESMEATGESAILVHSIVHLGRALGLTVTAEGVETPEQHRFLQALGCHQVQGYLFSKPVSAEAIDVLLTAERASLNATAA